MNKRPFNSRLFASQIPRHVAVMLVMPVALAWSSSTFCGLVHDAAQRGDLAKVKMLLKNRLYEE